MHDPATARTDLPSGTVTLVFTDVEGSTRLLHEHLDLLAGGRDADPRQRTLRATIEWSHDLLDPAVFDEARERGQRLDPEVAVAMAVAAGGTLGR